jgi:hypothetical protein
MTSSKLAPAQEGPPLNYFVYPYVEIGGKEYPNVSIAFWFEDVDTKVTSARAVLAWVSLALHYF